MTINAARCLFGVDARARSVLPNSQAFMAEASSSTRTSSAASLPNATLIKTRKEDGQSLNLIATLLRASFAGEYLGALFRARNAELTEIAVARARSRNTIIGTLLVVYNTQR
jgi:hypothetical protein